MAASTPCNFTVFVVSDDDTSSTAVALADVCEFDRLELKRKYLTGFSNLVVSTCHRFREALPFCRVVATKYLSINDSFVSEKRMTPVERFDTHVRQRWKFYTGKSFVWSPWKHRVDGTGGLSVTQVLQALRLTPFTCVCQSLCHDL